MHDFAIESRYNSCSSLVERKGGEKARKEGKYVTLCPSVLRCALCDSFASRCVRARIKKGGTPLGSPPPNQPKKISAKIETGSSEFFSWQESGFGRLCKNVPKFHRLLGSSVHCPVHNFVPSTTWNFFWNFSGDSPGNSPGKSPHPKKIPQNLKQGVQNFCLSSRLF